MMELLQEYPDNVIAIECIGEITADDYKDILIPEITKRLSRHSAVSVLCVIGERFTRYTPGAAWSDFSFGISHWNQFSRMAVVTEVSWIRDAMALFTPIFHSMRSFHISELETAKQWILDEDKT